MAEPVTTDPPAFFSVFSFVTLVFSFSVSLFADFFFFSSRSVHGAATFQELKAGGIQTM